MSPEESTPPANSPDPGGEPASQGSQEPAPVPQQGESPFVQPQMDTLQKREGSDASEGRDGS